MNWKIIDKSKTTQPQNGKYSDWKGIIAHEGFCQCVYCSTKDSRLGGIRNYHVEHFKPKSKFPALKNDISNLYYSCPICNVFKGNDWHDPQSNFDRPFYPNPSKINYSMLFFVDMQGNITGRNTTGQYIVIKLGLNRRQLVIDRRLNQLILAYSTIRSEYNEIIKNLFELSKSNHDALGLIEELHNAYEKVIDFKDRLYEATPYCESDTKKSN